MTSLPRYPSVLLILCLAACEQSSSSDASRSRLAANKLLRSSFEAWLAEDNVKALAKARSALDEDPGFYLANFLYYRVLSTNDSIDEAVFTEAWSEMLDSVQDDALGQLFFGVYHIWASEDDAAHAAFVRAIELLGANEEALKSDPALGVLNAVGVYMTEGKEESLESIDAFLKAYPGHPLGLEFRNQLDTQSKSSILEWVLYAIWKKETGIEWPRPEQPEGMKHELDKIGAQRRPGVE